MATLTKAIRTKIVRNLIDHKFKDRYNLLIEQRASLALDVYRSCFSADDRKRMGELPEGWLPTRASISVKHGASYTCHNFSGAIGMTCKEEKTGFYVLNCARRPKEAYQRFPYDAQSSCREVFEADHPLSLRCDKLSGDLERMKESVNNDQAVATATLAQFGTIEKLVDAWPEIKPFLPEPIQAVKNLPAISTPDLNSIFGLPAPTREG